MKPLQPPSLVRDIARACHRAGGRAFLVGGVVRDHLLGKPVKDWDIEVYGLPARDLERVLRSVGRVNTVGKAFSVFKLRRGTHEIDVSLPRRDSHVGPGHKGIKAEGDPFMSFAEATRRRDLTINALMWDLGADRLIDVVGGRDDLERGVLRMVDETTFLEDPLRTLRVVQFAARLSFEPTEELKSLCRRAHVHELPPERILGEWTKLLLKGRPPSVGMRIARQTRLLERIFPEAAPADDDEVFSQLDHAVPARDRLEEAPALALMLVVWLARVGPAAREATLDRLRIHRWLGYPVRERVLTATAHLDSPISTASDLRWLSTRAEVSLVLHARSATAPGPSVTHAQALAAELGILHEAPSRLLLGRDLGPLGVPPGPMMGRVLEAIYAMQLDGQVETTDEAREAARAWLDAHDS